MGRTRPAVQPMRQPQIKPPQMQAVTRLPSTNPHTKEPELPKVSEVAVFQLEAEESAHQTSHNHDELEEGSSMSMRIAWAK